MTQKISTDADWKHKYFIVKTVAICHKANDSKFQFEAMYRKTDMDFGFSWHGVITWNAKTKIEISLL